MANDPPDDKLRQMAEHRGFKLVRSRRRKPGVGDYGLFGLTDAAGKPLLGIGKQGLTASAQDVETYLRSGALGTWQESADTVPDRPPATPSPRRPDAVRAPATAKSRTSEPRAATKRPEPAARKVEPPPPPPPPAVRAAKLGDAAAIAALLGQLRGIVLDAESARRNLGVAQKNGGGFLLAEQGVAIGCCGWAVVPTVQRGLIGRITVLLVAADHRRRGVATQLLAAAEQALAASGCAAIEAMSDIEIANAHGFFRACKFEQASYRFTRTIAPAAP